MPWRPASLLPLAVVVIVGTYACSRGERAADTDTAAPAGDAVGEVHALYAGPGPSWNAGDPEPAIALLADDVVQMPPDTVHHGKQALSTSWRNFLGANTATWTPTVLKAAARGDLAFLTATFTEAVTPKVGGATVTESALAFNVYRKDAEGRWKLVLESWYQDPLVVPSVVKGHGPSSPAEDSVRAVFDAYAKGWTGSGVEPAIALLHDDVVQLGPDSTYVGKEALATSWRDSFKVNDYVWSPTVLDVVVSGDLAYVRYTGLETSTPRTGGETRKTASSGWDVLRRDGAGGWKLVGEAWYEAK